MIGVHRSSISGLKAKPVLDPASKQGKLALLLIDIYLAVYALSGGDPEWINYFMNSFNEATKGVPIELIQSINGLVKVLHFLTQIGEKYPA
ncbi:antitoxin Xre/MbcA/ParS toxin-binding domain-containing protein [Acinetobacter sp. A47]|uniref:antitoxin Xre/MbcA/ParS toxin-binding domain-containing protein n=1 Tax=Acinetobacter sp. A47 TaxID=1561217 RepID=UPI000B2CD04B